VLRKFILTYSLTLSVIWALVVLVLCAFPGQYIPSIHFLELMSFDKFVHAGVFFVLCAFIFITLRKKKLEKCTFIFFFLSVFYGVLLEIMQAYVFSHRSADWMDVIANSTGCLLALIYNNRVYKFVNL